MARSEIMDLPSTEENCETRNDILSILEENEENFVAEFVSTLENIFSCNKQSICHTPRG